MKKKMFEDVRVGDKVWAFPYGWGIVIDIHKGSDWPIDVNFKATGEQFTLEGKLNEEDLFPVLFWDKVKVGIPPQPKRKVKRYINLYFNVAMGRVYAGDMLHTTKKIAIDKSINREGYIKTIEIEIDEE